MKPQLDRIDLYFITDSRLTKKTVYDDVKSAINAGVKIIQYREKEKSAREMLEEAERIRELCREKAIFLINDRVDIALGVNADGVHLGNSDMPYKTARSLLGKRILGLTVHNKEEAIEAERIGADYVGVSPIFETKTKDDAGPAGGLKLLEEVKESVSIPLVAIGGITPENVAGVIKSGAASAAAISAIIAKDDVEAECRRFIEAINNSKRQNIKGAVHTKRCSLEI